MESYGNPSDFSNQISSNPIESCGIHEILAIKSHQTQWNLVGPHAILAIKSHQIHWNLIGTHEIQQPNLIKPTGTFLDPWDFSNQISSNPVESYGIHEV